MNRTTEKHLASLEHRVAILRPPSAALDGVAELRRLGIDLSKLSYDELDRLEMLAGAWPPESGAVPAAAIWACLGSTGESTFVAKTELPLQGRRTSAWRASCDFKSWAQLSSITRWPRSRSAPRR